MLRGVLGSGGGAAIGGGGTSSPSTIPRWTGPSTLGDSALVQSGTNAVGFGTPKTWGTNFTTNAIQLSESSSLAADVNTTYLAANQYWDSPGFQNRRIKANFAARYLLNGATGDHQFQIAPFGAADSGITWSTAMTILNTSGNVGIGTASPANLLTLSRGNGSGFNLQYDAAGNARTGLFLATRGSSSAIIGGGSEWADATTTARSTAATAILQNAGVIQFFTDTGLTSGNTFTPTERARIDSAGNVGIGTATPLSYANYVSLTIGGNDAAKTGILKFRSTYNGGNGAEIFQSTAGVLAISANGSRSIMSAQNTGATDSAAQVAIGTGSFTSGRALTTVADLDVFGVRVGRGAGDQASNTIVGASALTANTTGINNTAIGNSALQANVSGSTNTAVGLQALLNSNGSSNVAIGPFALGNTSTGSSNIALGREATTAAAGDSNQFVLGSATYYVATNGGATTYYATAGALLGYMQIRLNGANVKIPVYAP